MAAAALSSTLGAASYALLEEAGVAEYVAETLTGVLDEGGGMEEMMEAVLPFLLDAGAVPGEEEGEAVCAALLQALSVGGDSERKNIDVVRTICRLLDEMVPESPHWPHDKLIEFVTDRPGHDARYAIDASKITTELGWRPRHGFEDGLRQTVLWYLDHKGWWERVMSGAYRGERLGLG